MAIVLSVPGSEPHANRLATAIGARLVHPEVRRFPDGELYVRIDPTGFSAREDVIIATSLDQPAEKLLVVAFLAGTARDLGATKVGLVAPYLAFMRQDIRFKPGEGVTSTYFAKLLSSTIDWMVTVDPHLHRWPSLDPLYPIPTTIARAAPAIAEWVKTEVERPVLVGPDAESRQWVEAVARACDVPFLVLEKTRRGDRDVSVSKPEPPSGHWDGHTPVVIDDIISTGRTMVEATRALREAGASAPICVGIHAVFADAVTNELHAAGASRVVTCNTLVHPSNAICVGKSIADATLAHL
jgi:ribose-phosphate pyrophosphokinase